MCVDIGLMFEVVMKIFVGCFVEEIKLVECELFDEIKC